MTDTNVSEYRLAKFLMQALTSNDASDLLDWSRAVRLRPTAARMKCQLLLGQGDLKAEQRGERRTGMRRGVHEFLSFCKVYLQQGLGRRSLTQSG
jgi:hypothetical protein